MRTPLMLTRTVQLLLTAVLVSLSLPSLSAQSKEFATVIELQGQVSVLRGGQVPLFQIGTLGAPAGQMQVNPKEEIVTGSDGHAIFQTSDGSTFEVFANSRVTFQGQWTIQDMLQVLLGKIRVSIEHRNGPNHKRISTPTAVISVRGTVFDVEVQDDLGTTTVSVEEGEVVVQHALQPGPPVTVDQGHQITVYPNAPLKASVQSPYGKLAVDAVKRAAGDILVNNPGGVFGGGGGIPGVGRGTGPQGDGGKTKK